MKAAGLEEMVARITREHGDCDVVIRDADTDWYLAVKEVRFEDGFIVLCGRYHDTENPGPKPSPEALACAAAGHPLTELVATGEPDHEIKATPVTWICKCGACRGHEFLSGVHYIAATPGNAE